MEEFIHNFGIDGRLLLAQAVNFLILLVLLNKFAYRPILAILQKRRDAIARGIAATKEADERLRGIAKKEEEVLLQAQRDALATVAHAEHTAQAKEKELMAATNKKVEEVVRSAKRLIEIEKTKMGDTVYQEARELVQHAVGKILSGSRNTAYDAILIDEALRELRKTP